MKKVFSKKNANAFSKRKSKFDKFFFYRILNFFVFDVIGDWNLTQNMQMFKILLNVIIGFIIFYHYCFYSEIAHLCLSVFAVTFFGSKCCVNLDLFLFNKG